MEICHAVRSVLVGDELLESHVTQRGKAKLTELRAEHPWATDGRTSLIRDGVRTRSRWWTFAGARANKAVAAQLDQAGFPTMAVDDLAIGLRTIVPHEEFAAAITAVNPNAVPQVDRRRLDTVKFGSCIPDGALGDMLAQRDSDTVGVANLISEPLLAGE